MPPTRTIHARSPPPTVPRRPRPPRPRTPTPRCGPPRAGIDRAASGTTRREVNARICIPQGPGCWSPRATCTTCGSPRVTAEGAFQGDYPFVDTDVYKWLEAASWQLAQDAAAAGTPRAGAEVDRIIALVADGPAARRLPQHLVPAGQGRRAVPGPALGPRAVLRRPPHPGRRRPPPGHRRHRTPRRGPQVRRPHRLRLRPARQRQADRRHRRPPRGRDRPGRAVPGDRRAALPRPRRLLRRPARPRPARRRGVLPGPRPAARGAERRGPRRTPAVPAGRRGRPGHRDRRRRVCCAAASGCGTPWPPPRPTSPAASAPTTTRRTSATRTNCPPSAPTARPAPPSPPSSGAGGWPCSPGEARYSDLIERTLYNGFLAGVSLDGESWLYVNPLQVRDGHTDPGGDQSARRTRWFRCACCPPNVMRLLASLEHYLASTDGSGPADPPVRHRPLRTARPMARRRM